jgi:glycosyltransferase involved in cell wall biosynthesis
MSRILLWHGYLLAGSGSNIYTANTARVWRAAGHDVLLLCQERKAQEHDFVDAAGDFAPDNTGFDVVATRKPAASGRCRVARPAIGDLLPVYVYDDYEGFIVKRFVDLTDSELDAYTRANVEALVAATREHAPEALIVGHEVMGPFVARQARARTAVGYLAKLHGSALEYAVKLQERYRAYAAEGLGAAGVVVGGSAYMIEEASSVVPGWRARATVVNPGCDVELFRPRDRLARGELVVGFVGKLIAAKGVHNLIAALGLTQVPGLRAEVVGYGDFEGQLRDLVEALGNGDGRRAEALVRAPGFTSELSAFLEAQRHTPAYWRRARSVPMAFRGRLDHGPLSVVLPTFDLLVVPSVVPEAFGMVAVEAAACGVLPVVPRHSGVGEVGAILEAELEAPGLLTYDPSRPIEGIAAAIDRVLSLDPPTRHALERKAARLARARWSWERVAERLLELGRAAAARTG